MYQQSIPVSPPAEVFINQIHGDLQTKGWDRPEALIRVPREDDLSIRKENDMLYVDCRDDCSISLPSAVKLHIGQVQGNVRIKYLENRLQIDQVNGSVVILNVQELRLNSVSGNLSANQIAGDMIVDRVNGSVSAQLLEKRCIIHKVNGHLHLFNVKGDISAHVNGHAFIRQIHLSVGNWDIESNGHMNCQLPEGISAEVYLKSQANLIQVQLAHGDNQYNTHEKQITLGEGDARLALSAGGNILLTCQSKNRDTMDDFKADFDFNFEDISKTYMQQIEEQFERQMDVLNEHMERLSETLQRTPLPSEDIERMVERARRSSVSAAQRAQEKMQRAQEKLEMKLAAARRKSESKAHRPPHDRSGMHIQWDAKPKSPPPVDEPISQDERLMILRMLEQKKISIDEAEKLLCALEGEGE